MKIRIKDYGDTPITEGIEMDVGGRAVDLEGVYNGVGIQTDQGYFGICQRDSGIEIMLDGVLVWSSADVVVKEPESVLGADRPIVVFDLETTGTSPSKDRIIQFSAQKLNEKLEVVDELDISMNPGYPISPGASRVHGWTNKDLEDSPPFTKMAPKIVKFLQGCDFCGHNLVGFDLKILTAEFERHTKFKIRTEQKNRRLIDTLKVSRKMRRGGHRLGECLQHYCGEDIQDAHDGLADVKATVKVLKAMLDQEKIGLNQADRISRGLRTSLRK